MITEEEAKTKRCQESFGPAPVATVSMVPMSPGNYQINPPMYPMMPTNCIGSGCMAWRWLKALAADGLNVVDTDRGYCGKAGKP